MTRRVPPMSSFHTHWSSPAKSGPPNDPPKPPAKPPPPPPWLHTLWLVGLALTLVILFLPGPSRTKTTSLTYTDWTAKVTANQVKTATIDTSGKVTGQLTDNSKYSSRIPTAVRDDTLLPTLATHHVTVKAVTDSTSIWSVARGLLPFLLLLLVYFYISRRATRQLTGGLIGIGSSTTKD